MKLLSVNLGRAAAVPYTDHPEGVTGIDKRPVEGAVRVTAPGSKGTGASGLAGDAVCDTRHHGGTDQAVYAVAREDLDDWERELGRPLPNGSFGENLTTAGVDVSGALIGERWRIGPGLVLEVTSGRIPCRTFQGHLGEKRWVKRFTEKGAPGAYLRVVEPGEIRAGDPVEVVHRPGHGVTVALQFRAVTTERELLPRLLAAADALHPEALATARKYVARQPS
ncbi:MULTISPECIES: MOSC domain-containing protein [Streptomyces]|uniref:MOSC domain-containing protein n=2 Tax=Streptomyces rochei group TaxID=2867164 RepID=A0AAX3ZP94_STRRO|nr:MULTISPECIES: MOSC domain-containing protein [Streptomyces]MDV6288656.1 MOSC domain-containing protein [Streptomyces sp. UP1A-1]RIH59175.1 MOSC domain-containing protein [Streptomyces sp. SHP22-7]KYK17077.1 sulfurase [Streptomyces sp. CC71]MBJ6621076.1 MOSC domain-containing protein [Streptomyces sp. DHE17-7]MBQ0880323.1 MOSC domain-containing protein [Streptomyces sp. RT42]